MSEARRRRGDETRQRLMRAAEYLVAKNGIENVTVRSIIQQAEQKNESALQYHFKNRDGLLNAIFEERNSQILRLRKELLTPYINGQTTEVADICRLMIMPAFLLAREDIGFRYYIRGFAPRISQSSRPVERLFDNAKGEAATFVLDRLGELLVHLPEAILHARLESAIRFISLSMSYQAAEQRGFDGVDGDKFIANLLDSTAGILSAPVSAATAKLYSE